MVRVCFCSFFTGSCIDTGRLSNVIVLYCCGRLREGFVPPYPTNGLCNRHAFTKLTGWLIKIRTPGRPRIPIPTVAVNRLPRAKLCVYYALFSHSLSLSPFICDDVHCSGVCVRLCESFIAPRGFGFSCLEVVGRGRVPFILRSFHTGHNTTGPRATTVSGRVLGRHSGGSAAAVFGSWAAGSLCRAVFTHSFSVGTRSGADTVCRRRSTTAINGRTNASSR